MRKILKQKVYHDGRSMIVLNPGDRHDVPARFVQDWIDEGIIVGKTSKQIAAEGEPAPQAVEGDEGEQTNPFTAEHKGFGVFKVSGPGLSEPEEVKGKEATEARLAELWEAHKAADGAGGEGDAPVS